MFGENLSEALSVSGSGCSGLVSQMRGQAKRDKGLRVQQDVSEENSFREDYEEKQVSLYLGRQWGSSGKSERMPCSYLPATAAQSGQGC